MAACVTNSNDVVSSGFVLPGPAVPPAALLPAGPDPPGQHQDRGRQDQRERRPEQSGHRQDRKTRTNRRIPPFLSLIHWLFKKFCFILKVLEKMRPLDHKLKYQIDKLLRTAVTGSLGESGPLMNINNF